MTISSPLRKTVLSKAILAGLISLSYSSYSAAVQLEFGDDSELSGNINFNLGYATSFRTEDANRSDWSDVGYNILSDSRVPDKGDRISSVSKAAVEVGLDWKNYGLVTNVVYQYDSEIMNEDAIDFAGNPTSWTDAAKDYAGNSLDVLDAYVYGTFDINNQPLEVRAGKQVINWGEGLYFIDGVATQVPLNINKLVTPGAELKEAYIGVTSLYAQMGLGADSSLEAYIQTGWNRTEFPPRGTFYGDDTLFRGGDQAVSGVPAFRGSDQEASDSGQWGVAYRTTVGNSEVGFYYSRYHETFPFLIFDGGGEYGFSQYWPEDLDMFGTSFASTLGDWSFNGELAYRPDRPLYANVTDSQGRNAEAHDTLTGSMHGILLSSAGPFGIDSQVYLLQLGVDYIDGNTDNLPANSSITRAAVNPDNLAYGVAAEWIGTWQGAYPGVDVSLDLYLQKDIEGNSHFWGNFAEDRLLGSLSLSALIGNNWEASAGYSWSVQDNSIYETQDTFDLSVNYKF